MDKRLHTNEKRYKGAEPEGITVGQAYGITYAFVGLERAGGIMIFDIAILTHQC